MSTVSQLFMYFVEFIDAVLLVATLPLFFVSSVETLEQ